MPKEAWNMFSNLQIRPAKPQQRKTSMAARAGVSKRRVSQVTTSVHDIPSMSFLEDLFGDEFPEAFSGGRMKSSKSILDLPAELLAVVCEHLSKLDIKRLRLANAYLAKHVDLRIDRVYISPNRANLDCLQKILHHPRYRFHILELVWDDAQLDEYPDFESFHTAVEVDDNNIKQDTERLLKDLSRGFQDDIAEFGAFEHDDLFDMNGKLTEMAKAFLLRQDSQSARDIIARNATVMSLEESFAAYQELYQDERDIMKQGLDAAALQHALAVCPNLVRVILTSEVWRPWNLQPVYHTPFHHSLPPGFRKPSVWPWLSYRPQSTPGQIAHRDSIMKATIIDENNTLSSEFRGYSIVVSSLISMPNPQISEFIVYAGHETTGISHQLFATPNVDWTNTMTMAHRMPLKRLALSINPYGADHSSPHSYFRSGLMCRTLNAMPLLEHLDLSLNCYERRNNDPGEQLFFWKQIIPSSLLPRLRTFALRNVSVFLEDLLELVQLMTNAEHITLDNIRMDSIAGFRATYYKFFRELWMRYDRSPESTSRPAYTVIEPCQGSFKSRMVCEELWEWLYRGEYHGQIPFVDRVDRAIQEGAGWVLDDRDERFLVRANEYGEVE
jgi:hypothetical protein